MAFALAIWLDYNHCCANKAFSEDSVLSKWWIRLFTFIGAFLFAMSIGYSRFVLGMHSMNQIVFGLLLGAWVAVSFHFLGYEPLCTQIKSMLSGEFFETDGKRRFLRTTLVTFGVFGVAMVIQIVDFLIVSPGFTPQQIWLDNLTADCADGVPTDSFMALGLIQSGIISIGFGAYYGTAV